MWAMQPKPEPCVGGLGISMPACNHGSHDACMYITHAASLLQTVESVNAPHAYYPPPPRGEGVTFPGPYRQVGGCDTMLWCMVAFQRMWLHELLHISLEYCHTVRVCNNAVMWHTCTHACVVIVLHMPSVHMWRPRHSVLPGSRVSFWNSLTVHIVRTLGV